LSLRRGGASAITADVGRAAGGYSSTSEYVRELLRAEQKRQAREALELELLRALKEPAEEITPEYWEKLRREAHERMTARRAAAS
jgi:antitoxin ParD1/3/4